MAPNNTYRRVYKGSLAPRDDGEGLSVLRGPVSLAELSFGSASQVAARVFPLPRVVSCPILLQVWIPGHPGSISEPASTEPNLHRGWELMVTTLHNI